jgi:hypothetical protein
MRWVFNGSKYTGNALSAHALANPTLRRAFWLAWPAFALVGGNICRRPVPGVPPLTPREPRVYHNDPRKPRVYHNDPR